ncbi:MAG: hypothetical protein ACXVIJ_14205, partial [Thermoanaerobaculia bacterium]
MPWSPTPRGAAISSPVDADNGAAFRHADTLDHRICIFGAVFSTAHPIARLRIADVVAAVVARLASDLPGSALVARAGSRGVTYRISRFAPSFRTSRAWSHPQFAARIEAMIGQEPAEIIDYYMS